MEAGASWRSKHDLFAFVPEVLKSKRNTKGMKFNEISPLCFSFFGTKAKRSIFDFISFSSLPKILFYIEWSWSSPRFSACFIKIMFHCVCPQKPFFYNFTSLKNYDGIDFLKTKTRKNKRQK